jgi:hypothetical protein
MNTLTPGKGSRLTLRRGSTQEVFNVIQDATKTDPRFSAQIRGRLFLSLGFNYPIMAISAILAIFLISVYPC